MGFVYLKTPISAILPFSFMRRNGVSHNGVSGNRGVRQWGCQATRVSGNAGVRQRGVSPMGVMQRVSRDEAGLVWAKFYGLLGLT